MSFHFLGTQNSVLNLTGWIVRTTDCNTYKQYFALILELVRLNPRTRSDQEITSPYMHNTKQTSYKNRD